MRRLAGYVLLLAMLSPAGCNRGEFGKLDPVAGNGVERGDDRYAAVVKIDGISATIKARWAAKSSQGFNVSYSNGSSATVSLPLSHFTLHHRLGDAPLWSGVETTGADPSVRNVEPPLIYSFDGQTVKAVPIVLKPGDRRDLHLSFTLFPGDGSERITAGDPVTMTVPLGKRDATIRFTAASSFPF